MPSASKKPINPMDPGHATPPEGSLIARLKALEEELEDVQEQKRVALSRSMRGAEKDNLRRRFERQEALAREKIEAIKALMQET